MIGRRALPLLLSTAALLGAATPAVASDAGIRSTVKTNEKRLNTAQAKVLTSLSKLSNPKAGTKGVKTAIKDIHSLRTQIADYSRKLKNQDADTPTASVPQDSLLDGLRDLRVGYTSVETALKRLTVPKKKFPKTKAAAAKLYKALQADVTKGLKRIASGSAKIQVASDALLGRTPPPAPAPEPAPEPAPAPTPDPAPAPTPEPAPEPAPAG
ncbi:hypothetical protein [Patulibacter defluvii]|uniref:hypothetical protein n=1 Tax=Patulibacter defluvii TaxID=3095358 RepID=UPI002A758D56|nr:hypothetical protein [Patulibacter sp. DM4]